MGTDVDGRIVCSVVDSGARDDVVIGDNTGVVIACVATVVIVAVVDRISAAVVAVGVTLGASVAAAVEAGIVVDDGAYVAFGPTVVP